MSKKARKDPKGRALQKGESYRETDNRYRYTYKDINGVRRDIYAPDLQTLREKEREILKYVINDMDAYSAGKVTLNFMFDRYIKTKTNLKKTTRSNYKYMYNHFVRDNIGGRKIVDLKYSEMMNFYLYLLNDCKMMVSTIDTIQTILHPTFQMAVRDGILRMNPTDNLISQLSRATGAKSKAKHALTREQQKAFLNFVYDHPVYNHWFPLFVVLMGTGARIGEILGLRWEDIDCENGLINIKQNLVYYTNEDEENRKSGYSISNLKTEASKRYIPMMNEVREAFEMEYRIQQEIGFNVSVIDGISGFVFRNRYGRVHNSKTINDTINRITADYNENEIAEAAKQRRPPVILPHFSCHILRHTFCTRLCEVEDNLKAIQSIMGHASIETTMNIYADATKERNIEAINTLSKSFKLFD